MLDTQKSQSLAEFKQSITETMDRLSHSGEPELLTVEGEARAVLLSPAAYEELYEAAMSERDMRSMRQALAEHAQGQGEEGGVFFDRLHAELVAMKAKQANAVAE